ncbi:hypothetical protein DFH09DRAFT_1372966 [Mycena vulgaris]|nr:hypothetical protein DFH09DRAFT_1372966 [Mycena vulgaris]
MPTQRAMASLFGLTLSLMHEFQVNRISITTSDSVSVAGINSHGGTTYVDVKVITSEVVIQPQTTITVLSAPTTATFTWVEDASGIHTVAVEAKRGIAYCLYVLERLVGCRPP